jgi:uncharacterized protein YigE (DUF2233 family)
MKGIIILLILIVIRSGVNCQSTSFQTFREVLYMNNSYDVVVIKCNGSSINKFSIIENGMGLMHGELMAKINADSSSFYVGLGISEAGCSPVGGLVENGVMLKPINTNDGEGNFYLKPNGAILISDKWLRLLETNHVGASMADSKWAYQSGPLLLDNGIINNQFKEKSTNQQLRSAVGVFKNKTNEEFVLFCTSTSPVNFYSISDFLLNKYECTHALLLSSINCVMTFPYDTMNKSALNGVNGVFCRYLKFTP